MHCCSCMSQYSNLLFSDSIHKFVIFCLLYRNELILLHINLIYFFISDECNNAILMYQKTGIRTVFKYCTIYRFNMHYCSAYVLLNSNSQNIIAVIMFSMCHRVQLQCALLHAICASGSEFNKHNFSRYVLLNADSRFKLHYCKQYALLKISADSTSIIAVNMCY